MSKPTVTSFDGLRRARRFAFIIMAFGLPFVLLGILTKSGGLVLSGVPFVMGGCAYFCGYADGSRAK